MQDKIGEIYKKIDAIPISQKIIAENEQATQKKVMNTFFRKGLDEMGKLLTPDELKTLSVEDDSAGGYLVAPSFFEKEIIDMAALEVSPMRGLCKTVSLSAENRYEAPTATAHGVASWTADAGTVSEDTTYATGLFKVPVEEMTCLYKVKQTLLQDSAFNLEAEMRTEYANGMGLLEGAAFISGTGIGRPEGILANAVIIAACVNSGNANVVTADGLVDLCAAPKSTYVRNGANAKFIMRRATMFTLVKLKDGAGQYLLGRLSDSPNFKLLGYDIVEMPDMPAVAADAYPIAFGNFKIGYLIVDKIGIVIIRDPFARKTTRVVEFLASRRVGGGVRVPEAIYVQKISA